jgi:hypothetical protein
VTLKTLEILRLEAAVASIAILLPPNTNTMGARETGVSPPESEIAADTSNSHQQDVELMALGEVPPEPEKSRSKLRITAILIALYVSSTPAASDEMRNELTYAIFS